MSRNIISRYSHRHDSPPYPTGTSVAALGQTLPFRDSSFDAIISVFGIPHYLHGLDVSLLNNDEAILAAYTSEVQAQDKVRIASAFQEVVRVLRPDGKGYFADFYRDEGQVTGINAFAPSDGTEVIEALDELGSQISYTVDTEAFSQIQNTFFGSVERRGVRRVIELSKVAA